MGTSKSSPKNEEYFSVTDSDESNPPSPHPEDSFSSESTSDLDFISDVKMFHQENPADIHSEIASIQCHISSLTLEDFATRHRLMERLSTLQHKLAKIMQPSMMNLGAYYPSDTSTTSSHISFTPPSNIPPKKQFPCRSTISREEVSFLHQRKSYGVKKSTPIFENILDEEEE